MMHADRCCQLIIKVPWERMPRPLPEASQRLRRPQVALQTARARRSWVEVTGRPLTITQVT